MPNVDETLTDREKRYGNFPPLAAVIQAFKSVARSAPSWPKMTAVQREAIDMTFTKMARALYGDPMHMDNYHDGAGYMQLAAEEFERAAAAKKDMRPATNFNHATELLGKEPIPQGPDAYGRKAPAFDNGGDPGAQ